MSHPVLIVGAGLAGLRCADLLHQRGVAILVLEAESEVGGRVRTEERDGFLLDRGFQVLNTAYPEARRALDLEALELAEFEPGALVHRGGRLHLVSDPFRRPLAAFQSALSPVGGLTDKLRVARLRNRVVRSSGRDLLRVKETTTVAHLRNMGFGPDMLDRFFRPFFGGVFLERELETSSRWFELLFRQFSLGSTTLPKNGMRQIPLQLASRLPADSVRLRTRVRRVTSRSVELEDGGVLGASAVVVATEEPVACELLGEERPATWRSVSCHYFSADKAPVTSKALVLEGESAADKGPRVNNMCVPSQVAASYAPAGEALVSVTALEESADPGDVLEVMRRWFGKDVSSWRALETVRIHYALPVQTPGRFQSPRLAPVHDSGVFVAGDHNETASIHGALVSGRKASERVLEALERQPDLVARSG